MVLVTLVIVMMTMMMRIGMRMRIMRMMAMMMMMMMRMLVLIRNLVRSNLWLPLRFPEDGTFKQSTKLEGSQLAGSEFSGFRL